MPNEWIYFFRNILYDVTKNVKKEYTSLKFQRRGHESETLPVPHLRRRGDTSK